MIKTTYLCDFCGEEITAKEYVQQTVFRTNPLHEWNLSGHYVMCEKCALKIDYILAKLKNSVLAGQKKE